MPVAYRRQYLKLKKMNGRVRVVYDGSTTSPMIHFLRLESKLLQCPFKHKHYITENILHLNLDASMVQRIVSFAQFLAANNNGYLIVVNNGIHPTWGYVQYLFGRVFKITRVQVLLRQNAHMYITKLAYFHGWGGIIHVPIAVVPSIKEVSGHLFRVINSSYDINMFEVFHFYLFIWGWLIYIKIMRHILLLWKRLRFSVFNFSFQWYDLDLSLKLSYNEVFYSLNQDPLEFLENFTTNSFLNFNLSFLINDPDYTMSLIH